MTDLFSRRMFVGSALALGAAARLPAHAALRGTPVIDVPLSSGRICRAWRYDPTGRLKGTIIFGHGAASAPWKYVELFAHWTRAGFRVIAPLHVDSTDHPDHDRFAGMASWAARIEDLRALSVMLGEERYVAAGHSYGALAALALGGATPMLPEGVAGPLADPRAALVLAYSPPGAMAPLIDAKGYATLAVPALIQTGTADIPPGGAWENHLLAYESAPAGGNRYALVLDGVDHYFGGAICRPELPGPKQTAQLSSAAQLGRVMISAWLRNEPGAHSYLEGMVSEPLPGERLTRR